MPPTNTAAYQPTLNAKTLVLRPAPYPSAPPTPDSLVIKTSSMAINPVDWILQHKGNLMMTWLKYPFIFGTDVAGTVISVGPAVTAFSPGDRVMGYCRGQDEKINDSAEAGFQEYVVLHKDLTVHVPAGMKMEDAVVIPLGFCTAAAGLFQSDAMGLRTPTFPSTSANKTEPAKGEKEPREEILLIWGGSTSVGCNAIQLATAAGYTVYTTCSAKNFEMVKSLGAKAAFDYRSANVVDEVTAAMLKEEKAHGAVTVGALTMGHGGADAAFKILGRLKGPSEKGKRKFIAMATYPLPEQDYTGSLAMVRTGIYYISSIAKYRLWGWWRGIGHCMIFASSICHHDVGRVVWREFLENSLGREGGFLPAPSAEVFVGEGGKNGLEVLQDALEVQRKGVSAKKIVVNM